MNRIGRKEISVAGPQGISLMTHTKFKRTADDPMRLIFSVRMRSIPGPRRISPLKDAVAFALQPLFEIGGVGFAVLGPSFHFYTHIVKSIARLTVLAEPAWRDLSAAPAVSNSTRTNLATS